MSVHTAVFGATIVALAALLGAAFAPGEYAALRQWWRRGRTEDAALLARSAEQPAERPRKCPRCSGTRCHYWSDIGMLCPPQRGPGLRAAFGAVVGRHEPSAVYRNAVAGNWLPPRARLYTLAERIGALPAAGVLP